MLRQFRQAICWLFKIAALSGAQLSSENTGNRIAQNTMDTSDQLDKLRAEQIVNAFGRAISSIGRSRQREAEDLIEKLESSPDLSKNIQADLRRKQGVYQDILSQKINKSTLPHPPKKIREAIKLLLKYETDTYNIETLRLGLQYLEYFE